MRVPRLRFTVRRMMIAVAIVGSSMGVAQLITISGRRVARAGLHANLARKCTRLADEFEAIYGRTASGWAVRGAPGVLVPMPTSAPTHRLRTMATWNYPTWEGADAKTQAPHD